MLDVIAPSCSICGASQLRTPRIAVVMPCYRVGARALDVIRGIGSEVEIIVAVDDACPIGTADVLAQECDDPRLHIVRCTQNGGVGAATIAGIQYALDNKVDIIVKIDGDGQMDPALIPDFIYPVAKGFADFTKGNRFFSPEDAQSMPFVRLVGNGALSFMAKVSTGYYSVFDPTNGYFAIHARMASLLPWDKLAKRYFFESDLLFRLGTYRAVVVDLPMKAFYGDEESNLHPIREVLPFAQNHIKNFTKRILYRYFLRDFNIGSVFLILGGLSTLIGAIIGMANWDMTGTPATAGTVMLAALPIFIGIQFLLSFLNFDIKSEPSIPICGRLFSARADTPQNRNSKEK